MRLAIRGWKGDQLVFQDHVEASESDLENMLPQLAEKHANALADAPHTVEIEFLDEPDPNARFFRMGTDPGRMVMPLKVQLPSA